MKQKVLPTLLVILSHFALCRFSTPCLRVSALCLKARVGRNKLGYYAAYTTQEN